MIQQSTSETRLWPRLHQTIDIGKLPMTEGLAKTPTSSSQPATTRAAALDRNASDRSSSSNSWWSNPFDDDDDDENDADELERALDREARSTSLQYLLLQHACLSP